MTPRAGWRRATDRLAQLGERTAATPGLDERPPAEALEHLVDQTVLWLGWEALHADPSRPFFHRHNDLVSQWGGPNADNVYRHARIDPTHHYIVRGRMHSCDELLITLRVGFMHQPVWGTLAQVTASDLGVGPGDAFELQLGGDHPGAIGIPDGTTMLSVREYYFEWTADEPALFTIECLDPEPPTALDSATIATRIEAAVTQVEQSIDYWDQYLTDHRAERTDNSFAPTSVAVARGLTNARYEFCFWHLNPDEALLVECTEPDARYWAAQLYTLGGFEPVDPFGSITSRNHTQSVVSPEGIVQLVLAADDPGAANWLDTGGRPEGLCTIRWFWPRNDSRPSLSSRVVPLERLADELGPGAPTVSSTDRHAELVRRQEHLRWRFRT